VTNALEDHLVASVTSVVWTVLYYFRQEMARQEGFEPPTPRSITLPNSESPVIRPKRRAIIQALGDSPSLLLPNVSGHCGTRIETNGSVLGRLFERNNLQDFATVVERRRIMSCKHRKVDNERDRRVPNGRAFSHLSAMRVRCLRGSQSVGKAQQVSISP
jgi:hypothetical protein